MEAVAEKRSTHKVEVVPVKVRPHPNADRLEIADVYGYQCVVAKGEWKDGDLGAYVVPDSLVDRTRPEFSFLGSDRVRVKKLRGVVSQGLLVKAPVWAAAGDDLADYYGVRRYEPPEPGPSGTAKGLYLGGEIAQAPAGVYPKYDVESWHRYKHLLTEGEPVVITEKLHGASARYVWLDGRLHCSSRTEWKKQFPNYDHLTVESLTPKVGEEKAREIVARLPDKPKTENLWWQAVRATPEVLIWLRDHHGLAAYGEVYGQVQDLKYGTAKGEVRFAAFDVLEQPGTWWDWEHFWLAGPKPAVPVLYRGPYREDVARLLADGTTAITGGDHVREGVVIRPVVERWSEEIGRVQLKLVSDRYLERA